MKGKNTEQMILQAAEAEFLDKGFALAKTTDIARAAGVTHAMLHYYYRTKEKLFEKVFSEKVRLLAQSIEATVDGSKPFPEQIAEFVAVHFDFIAANPKLPLFVINELLLNKERRKIYVPSLTRAIRPALLNLDRLLRQAVERGEIREVKTVDLVFSIASLNIMTFVSEPIVHEAMGLTDEEAEEFMRKRKSENIEMILSRLIRR